MKSTLKIDLDNTREPMILASVATDRTDLRDSVMNMFFNSLEHISDSSVTIDKGHLCFVEGFGRENSPEAYLYTIHPIRPGGEERYITRLQVKQIERIMRVCFRMYNTVERLCILSELESIHNNLTEEVSLIK